MRLFKNKKPDIVDEQLNEELSFIQEKKKYAPHEEIIRKYGFITFIIMVLIISYAYFADVVANENCSFRGISATCDDVSYNTDQSITIIARNTAQKTMVILDDRFETNIKLDKCTPINTTVDGVEIGSQDINWEFGAFKEFKVQCDPSQKFPKFGDSIEVEVKFSAKQSGASYGNLYGEEATLKIIAKRD